jgi:hypothetical protein
MGLAMALAFAGLGQNAPIAQAQPGTLLGTVTLPGNGAISVGGTFDGTYYIAPRDAFGNLLDVYLPPAGGNGAATLVSTKTVVDAANNPVTISTVTWDPSRARLWGGANQGNGDVYLIDIADPTVSADALAAKQFEAGVGGLALLDGIAYDASDDTLYYSPDVDCNVYQLDLPGGALLNTITPTNAAGESDCLVSGVAIGSANTLYIGRNGEAEIRRIDKTTGAFVSTFATTAGRVEDLVCDPVTYAPLEAILAKDAFNGLYEAFEVEPGTCPLPAPDITIEPATDTNEAGTSHAVTATVTFGGEPVVGALVSFSVTSGPNAGQMSDPGECSANADCTTDANGQVSWTYTGAFATGTDVIVACFTDERGDETCATATKRWVDTTAPGVACRETVNPAGNNVPKAPGNGGQGQNQDGFYELLTRDAVDANPQIFVVDKGKDGVFGTADDTTFGPYPSGTKVKYTEANGATPNAKPMGGPNSAIQWHITGNGDMGVFAVDAAGNVSAHQQCHVPPPPQ